MPTLPMPWVDHELDGVLLTNVELDRALANQVRALADDVGCRVESLLPIVLTAGLAVVASKKQAFAREIEAGRRLKGTSN